MSKSYPHLRTSFPVHPSHFRSSSCCVNLSPFMRHVSSPTPPAQTAIIARLQHNHNMRTVISFALGLLILERIVTDARQSRFEENRYPKYR